MNKDRIWTLLSRKLSAEATASEESELDDLLQHHPGVELPVQTIEEYWELPAEQDLDYLQATYHLHLERLKQQGFDLEKGIEDPAHSYIAVDDSSEPAAKPKKRNWVRKAAVLTGLAGMFVLLFLHYQQPKSVLAAANQVQSEVSTKNGSRTKIMLPDGTAVWLNGNSKLIYDNVHFGETNREVVLLGEGFFDVVKDPSKPFLIHARDMNIKVTGTAFNVKCYPEQKMETSLIRGSIEVSLKDRAEKILLKPNDKLIVEDEKAPVISAKTSKATAVKALPVITLAHLTAMPGSTKVVETAWVDNQLAFTDESFEEVALQMERWYGVSIRFDNPQLKAAHFTGVFEKETVTDALNALQLIKKFNYTINNNSIVITK